MGISNWIGNIKAILTQGLEKRVDKNLDKKKVNAEDGEDREDNETKRVKEQRKEAETDEESEEKEEIDAFTLQRIEGPRGIHETLVRPMKLPSMVEIGQSLGEIRSRLEDTHNWLQTQTPTKEWLQNKSHLGKEGESSDLINEFRSVKHSLDRLVVEMSAVREVIRGKNPRSPAWVRKAEEELRSQIGKFESIGTDTIILNAISEAGKACFSEIVRITGLSKQAASEHLKKLTAEGRLERTRRGKNVFYKIHQS